MKPLSPRHKVLGGVFAIAAVAGGIDLLTGEPKPSPASAARSPAVAAEAVGLPPDPVDLDAVIESLRKDRAVRPALPFEQVTRDLFVPTARMAAALAPAAPARSAEPRPPQQAEAEALAFHERHELQGVLTGRVPLALVDGLLCRQGAEIDGYRLVELQRDHVVFERDGSRVTLWLASPGER